jgi:hypothetical protein
VTLARDVAKELAKRSRRRRLAFVGVVAALIAGALLYLRCGAGWGFGGGSGAGKGPGPGGGSAKTATKDAGPKRCTVRLDAKGLALDGKRATQAEALAACKKAGRADVVVTGDARQGDWDALRQALDEAGVPHGTP